MTTNKSFTIARLKCITTRIDLRLLQYSVADPGFPVGGGVDLVRGAVDPRGGYVLKILHVKTKESGPIGGGARRARPPPRSANGIDFYQIYRVPKLYIHCVCQIFSLFSF